jgi:hypothetical protein
MRIRKFNESLDNQIIQTKGNVVKDSVPVTNNKEIMEYMIDIQMKSYKNDEKNLTSNLIDELTSEFGVPNKTMRLEYNTKLWFLEFKGNNYNIFTAKGKGTGIEICGLSYEEVRNGIKKEEIMEFLDELHRIVNK